MLGYAVEFMTSMEMAAPVQRVARRMTRGDLEEIGGN